MIASDNGSLKEALRKIDLKQYRPSLIRSMLYLSIDLVLLGVVMISTCIAATSGYYLLSLLLSLLAGNLFFSLFVLGHECGHGSFARSKAINNVIGFVLHHFLLTPYWGWKKSHQKHHRFAGDLERDESFVPFTKDETESLLGVEANSRMTYYRVRIFNVVTFFLGLNFHIYTVYNPKTRCSHFLPNKVFFNAGDKWWVYLGTIVSLTYFVILISLTIQSPAVMVFAYWLPLMVCFHILSFVTLMQHHHEDSTWYFTRDWDRLKGTLNTFDYRYGILNFIISRLHHNIANFHLVHHMFSSIPHYNLEVATRDIVGQSGADYRPEKFSYAKYVKIIWTCNYVENKNADQTSYSLKSFEEM